MIPNYFLLENHCFIQFTWNHRNLRSRYAAELGQCASQRSMAASHDCESCEPTWPAMRVNMRVTQLLKANHFKMGA